MRGLAGHRTKITVGTGPQPQSHRMKADKGSIEAGKRADLVILSANPTAVDPETLDTLKVVETVKEGKTIYAAEKAQREGHLRLAPNPRGHDSVTALLRGAADCAERSQRQAAPFRLPTSGRPARTDLHNGACLVGFLQAALEPPFSRRAALPAERRKCSCRLLMLWTAPPPARERHGSGRC